jgi:ABC-2 type transport system permease protein
MSSVATASFKRDLGLVGWQIRYEQRAYWRNRVRGVFTFVFPLMFLVIFGSLDKGAHISSLGGIPYDDFYVPGILAYGVIATTYMNMALSTSILRDQGVLKRMQGTPLPRWAYIAARVGSTVLIMLVLAVLTVAVGAVAYDVHLRVPTLPGLILTLLLGTAAFTTLGIGITRFIANAEAAPVIVNLTVLPLTFISSVWYPIPGMPKVLVDIAKIFPIQPLADGLEYAFNPHTAGAGIKAHDLGVLAIWTVIGIIMMLSTLRRPEGDIA